MELIKLHYFLIRLFLLFFALLGSVFATCFHSIDLDQVRFGFLVAFNLFFSLYSLGMLVLAIQYIYTNKNLEIKLWQKLTDLFFLIVGMLALLLVLTSSSFVHRNYFNIKISATWSVIVFDFIILFWLTLLLLLSHFGWKQ